MSTIVAQTKPIIATGGQKPDPKVHNMLNLDLLGDTIALPVGNDQNRALEDEVISNRKKLLKCRSDVESVQQKTDSLWRLINNLRIDLNENQNLLRAKTAALETEESLHRQAKEQSQKISKDSKKSEAELKAKQANYERTTATLEKQTKTLENIRNNKRIDREQFQGIVDEIVDMDDLNVTIQKYFILDEKTMTDLTSKLSKLSDQLNSKKRDLDAILVDVKAVESSLIRANGDFQREQSDRNRLLKQWEQAVQLLEKRDADMESVRRQAEEFRSEEFTWRDTLAEKEMEVKDQQSAESDLRRRINQLDQQLAKLKSDLTRKDAECMQKRDKFLTVSSAVNNEKSILKSESAQIAQLNDQLEKNTKKLEETAELKSEKFKSLESGKSQNESVEARRIRLNKELDAEKLKRDQSEKQRRFVSGQITKKKEQIVNGRKQRKELQSEFENLKTAKRNLDSKMKQQMKQWEKRKEALDAKESEINRLNLQLEKLNSTSSSDKEDVEFASAKGKLESKKGLLMEKEATEQTWTSTIKISQGEMEKAKKQLDKVVLSRRDLESAKGVLESEVIILDKRLKKLMDQKQEALAQSNLLESEINRLQDVLGNKSAEVNNVEEAKDAQEAAMKSQDHQLKQRKSEFQLRYLQAEEERKKLGVRLNEFQSKINSLTSKYDAYIRGFPDFDETNIESVAMKQAKERADRQKSHEELSSKLMKKEKEIAALNNTMRLISERNQTFRQGIVQADRNSAEYQEKFMLERQYQELSDRYREIRRRIKKYEDQMKASKDKSIDLEHKLIQLDIEIKRGEEEIDRLKSDIADQQDKLDRWQSQNEKMHAEFERASSAKRINFFQGDIDLRSMIALNSSASKALSEFTQEFPAIDGVVSEFCLRNGLELESPSDSGIGSALTRRSTMPARVLIKNGTVHHVPRKIMDAESLPPIAPRNVRAGRIPVKIRSNSMKTRRTTTIA